MSKDLRWYDHESLVTLTQDAKVKDAHYLMKVNKIGGIPVINQDKKLIGILTNRDLRFETEAEQCDGDRGKAVDKNYTQGTTLDQAKKSFKNTK
ncbi:MAG: CBS domain-containing protein [Saprospiraceae bacterium]